MLGKLTNFYKPINTFHKFELLLMSSIIRTKYLVSSIIRTKYLVSSIIRTKYLVSSIIRTIYFRFFLNSLNRNLHSPTEQNM